MGLNLAEIQQKLDRLIQNMSEQNRRAYQIFYDPNPQDVELPQLDENGNLITVTIPNRAKIKAEVDNFIAGARREYCGIRLTPNQIGTLPDGATLPTGWNAGLRSLESGESISSSIAFQFVGGDPNNQPNQSEVDAFYSDLGIAKPGWFARTINAIEITWNLSSPALFFVFASLNLGPAISHGAFIRRLEGSIEGSWSGTLDSELPVGKWKFCGGLSRRSPLNSYVHKFIKLNAGTGKIQIVAPAIVAGGYADVYWNIYPNFDGKYDE